MFGIDLEGKVIMLLAGALTTVALTAGGVYWGYNQGKKVVIAADQAKMIQQQKTIIELSKKSSQVTTQVVTKYITKVVKVKEYENAIQTKIDQTVTKADESQCKLSDNVIGLLNDAASNSPTLSASSPAGVNEAGSK